MPGAPNTRPLKKGRYFFGRDNQKAVDKGQSRKNQSLKGPKRKKSRPKKERD
jgi:hypothetical protein